jgi:alpha-aminoadipic semialdehyde synthase
LYDYELILGEHGERLVAFGQYAGLAGMIDLLRGLGERFLSQGFSTPFLSLGSSYMYTSLKEAKQAVLAVGEEIKNAGLPLGICPLIFVFTGTGNGCTGDVPVVASHVCGTI